MTLAPPRLVDYLTHITEAIERIARYTEGVSEPAFAQNPMIQDAVIRNLEIIGEASRNIEQRCPEFARQYPDLPLSAAYQMRNAVAHGYFKVDLDMVWKTIIRDLPPLQRRIQRILSTLSR
jgi:uncharacterized protein with HEPN domain